MRILPKIRFKILTEKSAHSACFDVNTLSGVSKAPKKKPERSGCRIPFFGLTPHAAQYPERHCSQNETVARLSDILCGNSPFYGNLPLPRISSFSILSYFRDKIKIFLNFFKISAENFREFFPCFLYNIHKFHLFFKKQRFFPVSML